MKTEKNIAKVIRESLRPTTENIEAKERADKLLPELYTDEKYEIKSRKGSRSVYKRSNFVLPSGGKTADILSGKNQQQHNHR